jgi:hypothetical protein
MAHSWYVDKSAGSNLNGGSSEGSPKASGATATWTATVTTIDLSADTPDLSTVVANQDTINLVGATGGLWDSVTVFKIVAVDDTLKTVTVSSAPTNSTSGAWKIGGAFATLQKAVDVHVAALVEHTYVKASAVYTEAVTSDHALGTNDLFSKWEGYTTTPGDSGIVEIDGQSARAIGIDFPSRNVVVKNFKSHHHTSHGFRGGDHPVYVHCESHTNGGNGFDASASGQFLKCYAHDNTAFGILSAQGFCAVLACVVNDNAGTYGVAATGGVAWKSVFRGNAGKAISMAEGEGTGTACLILDCLVDGDGKTTDLGVEFLTYYGAGNEGTVALINTLIYDCTKGVDGFATVGFPAQVLSYNNLVNGNTTAYEDFGTIDGEVTTTPTFVAEGTDYTPDVSSPALDAGVDQISLGIVASTGQRAAIGGIMSVEAVAGGGGLAHGWGWGD